MNLGIKWLWKNNEKVKVDKIKNDLTKLQTKVDTNTANIDNLEKTKATKSYVNTKIRVKVGRFNITNNGHYSGILENGELVISIITNSNKLFTNWYQNDTHLSFTNNTGKEDVFIIRSIVVRQ